MELGETEVKISSRDYWFKPGLLVQSRRVPAAELGSDRRSRESAGRLVFGDTSSVFDEMGFGSAQGAEAALRRNGFRRYAEDREAQEAIPAPIPPFYRRPHLSGLIYSSGRFWK
jgi:hypothetical protein